MLLHNEGLMFIIPSWIVVLLIAVSSAYSGDNAIIKFIGNSHIFSISAILIALFITAFFRSPDTTIKDDSYTVYSPAYGKIDYIDENREIPECLKDHLNSSENRTMISVFLNIFDVHITYSPIKGTLVTNHYSPGKFIDARSSSASEPNESNYILIRTEQGKDLIVRQRAGLIARRIVQTADVNQDMLGGEELGIIRFGSRVDLYLPPGTKASADILGKKVKGGMTELATIN